MTDEVVGEWACTCGEWHHPDQTECANGKQILALGEDWL